MNAMNAGEANPVLIKPVIRYPHEAQVGQSYLMTVDLQMTTSHKEWGYEDEEYPLWIILNTMPLFSCKPIGDALVVLHRFGGTYGPATFLLTASQQEIDGKIHITLVNKWGVPLQSIALKCKIVSAQLPSENTVASQAVPHEAAIHLVGSPGIRAEVAAIQLGSAIAKLILKLWLKDPALGEDTLSTTLDLLKTRTSDVFAQRRGELQFAAIGDQIGESLLPLLKSVHMEEGSRSAVLLTATETINKSKLSSEIIAEYNLDPMALAKYVLETYPEATRVFNENEGAFYRRIIEEACIYIVDIAPQLPSFSEQSFAEILKRESLLLDKVNQVLREISRLQEHLDPSVEVERFEIEYRLAVARNLDVLQLIGSDVSPVNRRYRLSVAYVALEVEQRSLLPSETLFPSEARYPTPDMTTQVSDNDELISSEILTVDRALASSQRLLIHGTAGSGKTTLLQWIAVRSATRSFEGSLSAWNNTLPFYIALRSTVQSELPRPEEFPRLVSPIIVDLMPKGWVHAQLTSGRAIVLVDGLDEVPEVQREGVRTWLTDLVDTYPLARLIVTSRPHVIQKNWLDRPGFTEAYLSPMELPNIYTFIDHWHKAVEEELNDQQEKDELQVLADHLKRDVRSNRSIRYLATTPLLCAMLCALTRDRKKQLPIDRIELYEACIALLLERRDKEYRIDLKEYPVLNYRQKRVLLEDLAFWMIRNGFSEISNESVDERFERKLMSLQGVAQAISGSSVRRLFTERSGIIREPVIGRIDFAHRTFQEFLAAKSALDEGDIGILIANAHNDQWQEVIILASGLATEHMREELIKNLLARGDSENEYRHQLHLLAVACLEASTQLGKELKMEVEKRLSQLIPPRNIVDAKALASAGELAVKHLARRELSASSTAACIRTLALIGGDTALDVLEEYAEDARSVVIDELFKSWDYFDRGMYASRILRRVIQKKADLHIEHLTTLEGFQYFTNLKTLNLSDSFQITDLSPLTGLTNLASLNLSGCRLLSDLTPLAALPGLKTLDLSSCQSITDLSPLAGLTQLTSLNLAGFTQVTDLHPLTILTQLHSLDLSRCTQVSDLSPLASLTNLASLNLSGCRLLSDLTPLVHLLNLRMLDLSSSEHIADLSALKALSNLMELRFSKSANQVNIPPDIKERVKIVDVEE